MATGEQEAAAAEAVAATASPNGDGTQTPEERAEHSPAETRDSSQLFEFSRYVHIGPAADQCPDGENGKCDNNLHVHLWIRLPNPFQHASIREKAQAAKARRLRLLRDEDSDARIVIEGALEDAISGEDRESLIEEIANKEFMQDHLKAMRNVMEDEEFKTVEDDQERARALQAMDSAERPHEEYEELQSHLAKFNERVTSERDKLQAPLRESVAEKSIEELADLVRKDRIQADAQVAFNDSYSKWEWFVGTLKPRDPDKGLPVDRHFSSIDQLAAMPPEVYNALDYHFTQIEAAQGRALKNS